MERFIDTRQGVGPWIVLTGGLLVVGAGLAGLAWAKAWNRGRTNADIDGESGAAVEENPPPSG